MSVGAAAAVEWRAHGDGHAGSGADRSRAAVRFSLGIAVPAICGAALYELKGAIKDPAALGLTPDRIAQTLAHAHIAKQVVGGSGTWVARLGLKQQPLSSRKIVLTLSCTRASSACAAGSPARSSMKSW